MDGLNLDVMKKYSFIAMLAVVAMAAFSCAKEVEQAIEVEPEVEVKPGVDNPLVIKAYADDDIAPDTKTSLSGVSIIWATTDAIAGYEGSTKHESTNTEVENGGKLATFTFSGVSVGTNLDYLIYPAAAAGAEEAGFYHITLPTEQTARANSFADGANISLAEGKVDDEDVRFKNLGALIGIQINNDNIESVKIAANEAMTGDGIVDPSDFSAVEDSGENYVQLTGGLTNGTPYYAVIYPGTYTGLKIEVTNTSGQVATYTNSTPLTIARNGNLLIAELTIPVGKWVTPTKGSEYIWTLVSGDLGSNGSPSAVISGKGTPAKNWSATYTFADATKYIGWEGTRGVQFGSGSHGCTSATFSTTEYSEYIQSVAVNAAATGTGNIAVSVNGVSLKYNSATSQALSSSATEYIFVADALIKGAVEVIFSGGNKAFYLKSIIINPDARTSQSLSFPSDAYYVDLAEGSFDSPILSGANTTVTYSSDNTSVATVDPSTGLVTLVSAGLANITATAEADETYKEGSATYALTVMTPSSIASVLDASTGTDVYTSGVVSQINNRGFILTDGTNNVFVYNGDEVDVVVGQAVKVRGTRGINNGIPQITSPVITKGSTGQSVERTALTVITKSNATEHTNSTYISLSGELSFSSPYYNVSIDGSSTQGSLYQVSGTEAYTAGTLSSLVGSSVVVTGYIVGSTSSYLSIAVVDIVIDTTTPTLSTTPESGETIEWADDKYGDENAETITVVLNGAASGYSLDYTDTASAWSVTDDEAGHITVYPKEANTSTTVDKELVLSITHKDKGALISTITLRQKKQKGSIPTLQYTLDGSITGGSNGYATESNITQNEISWKACGNTTTNPWRIGGKKITNTDRAIYSTASIPSDITGIEVTSGTSTLGSVNSLTITVHNSSSDAATGANAIATKTENNSSNIISKTVTLTKADSSEDWSGKYYRIVYNVTKTEDSNAYIQFIDAKFYGL